MGVWARVEGWRWVALTMLVASTGGVAFGAAMILLDDLG
jgi:hypothetical protein